MNYWEQRQAKARQKLTDKTIKETEEQMKKYYSHAMRKVIEEFENVYNGLLVSMAEEKEPTPADLYKLDKYWIMQAQLKTELEKLGDNTSVLLSKKFVEEYSEIYKAIALNTDVSFGEVDFKTAEQMINQIWCADGKSWSQRVWGNVDKLQQALNDNLIDCVLTGKKTSELKKMLMSDFNASYGRAETLVRTELAHIETEAARQRYLDYGLYEVEILVSPDERTCPICGDLEGKRYLVRGRMPVPAHPRCRCCIVPVVQKPATLTSKKAQDIIQLDERETKAQEKIEELKKIDDLKFYKKSKRHQEHAEELTGKKGEEAWAEYEKMASDFLKIDIDNVHMFGFLSPGNTLFKYQIDTNLFGMLSDKGTISTLFHPKRDWAYWEDQIAEYKEAKK